MLFLPRRKLGGGPVFPQGVTVTVGRGFALITALLTVAANPVQDQSWQARNHNLPGGPAGCQFYPEGLLYRFTLTGSTLSMLGPLGDTYPVPVKPAGIVSHHFTAKDGRPMQIVGSIESREFMVLNLRSGCAVGVSPVVDQGER